MQQALFLSLPVTEVLYGGAAGGGKSEALLMAALQLVDVPGYAALILRRSYADLALPGAIMDRSKEWLRGTASRWNEQTKTWTFPSGATLSFGYLETEQDKYRYQGAEFQTCAFDELTQFSETQYRYLFSRLRKLRGSNLPLRMRAASNPGGVGHEWVRQRFLIERHAERLFVPARLEDNPHLDRAAYEAALAQLDQHTRRQLREGDWFAQPAGTLFQRQWFAMVDAVPAGARRVRYWDLAATAVRSGDHRRGSDPDWTVGALVVQQDGRYWVGDLQRLRAGPRDVEQRIRQTAALDGVETEVWMEQEPGSAGVALIDHYAREVLPGYAFHGRRTTGDKQARALPVSAAAEAGNVLLVRGPWIGAFLDEVEVFPGGAHDDQVDAVCGAIEVLAQRGGVTEFLAAFGKGMAHGS